jgi:hypothetical protein
LRRHTARTNWGGLKPRKNETAATNAITWVNTCIPSACSPPAEPAITMIRLKMPAAVAINLIRRRAIPGWSAPPRHSLTDMIVERTTHSIRIA